MQTIACSLRAVIRTQSASFQQYDLHALPMRRHFEEIVWCETGECLEILYEMRLIEIACRMAGIGQAFMGGIIVDQCSQPYEG